jgi:DNA modification methylase
MNDFCDFSGYLIWAKPNPMPSLSKRHPTWNTELCAYGTRGTKRIVNFPSDGHFLSCREVIKKSDGSHPTQKPIELLEPLISFSSGKGQMIFDGFLGSGSTLIACEKTNRKCYSMEISPEYVDVAVKRFADFTHQSDNIYLERDGEKIPYSTLVDLNPIL